MPTILTRRRTVSHADGRVADDFERIHDARVVRPSEVQGLSLVHSDLCELGDCLCRIFSVVYLKEALKWNYVVGFALIVVAVFIIFKEW
jgi:hypothetical protein